MIIQLHTRFEKEFKRQSLQLKDKIYKRIYLFSQEPFHPILNNHALIGKYVGYRSINVTGDIRILYKQSNGHESVVLFMIGTHSKLYS